MRVLKLSSAAVIVLLLFASLPCACASTPPSSKRNNIATEICGVAAVSQLEFLRVGETIRLIVPSSEWIAKSVDQGLENRILFETKKKSLPRPPSVCTDEEIVNEIMKEASPDIVSGGNPKDLARISKFKTIFRELVKKSVMERKKKPEEEDYRKPSACEKMKEVNDWLAPIKLSWMTVNWFCKELLKEIVSPKQVSLYEVLVHAKM